MIKHSLYVILLSAALLWDNAFAAGALPAMGTDAEGPPPFDEFVQDAGRPVKWDLRYIDDTYSSLSHEGLDGLAEPQRGISAMIITLQIQASLADITTGKRDGKLRKIAKQMADWQKAHPATALIIRPFHEMNGNWYPWGFKDRHHGNSVTQFNHAWRHVRAVMRKESPALPFMWCPNTLMGNNDHPAAYYPGNDQTEYLCLDGYNFSSVFGGWTPIGTVFHDSLVAIRSIPGIDKTKPIVIGETGTTEPDAPSVAKGHSKAEWFTDMGNWLHNEAPKFGVMAVLYFNYNKPMGNKPCNFLIYDPALPAANASREAFRKAVADLP